jgi:hypothetical protein
MAAGDVERDCDAISDPSLLDPVAHRLDHPDGLVSERLPRFHRGLPVEQVEIAPADRRAGDPHDRIARRFELRIGQVDHADRAHLLEHDPAHQCSSGNVVST